LHALPEQDKVGEVRRAAGFAAVLELLRASGKPAVGHNLGFDAAFTLEHLAQPLPPAWPAFKALARAWFPGAHGLQPSDIVRNANPALLATQSLSMPPALKSLSVTDGWILVAFHCQ
jgi:poly(A)-specific ribonuclease